MTTPLEKAFAAASKLSDEQQDTLAEWILDELADEQAWQRHFEASADILAELADEALQEHRAGRTQPLGPERL